MCQEALGAELAMLPCGHQLCVRCQMALIDRLPGNLPRARSPLLRLAAAGCLTCGTALIAARLYLLALLTSALFCWHLWHMAARQTARLHRSTVAQLVY